MPTRGADTVISPGERVSATRWQALRDWLGRHSNPPDDLAVGRKARLLALGVGCMIPFFLVVDAVLLVKVPGYRPPWFGYLILMAAFAFNRSGSYGVAAWLVALTDAVVVFTQLRLGTTADPMLVLGYLPVGLFLGAIFLSSRGMVVLSALHVIGVALIPVAMPMFPETPDLVLPLSANLITGAAAVLYMRHRDQLEGDRQRELASKEERLRMALDAAEMGTWDWEPSTGRAVVSPGVDRILGIEAGAVPPSFDAYIKCLHPDDQASVRQELEAALSAGTELRVVSRVIHPGGSVRWLDARGFIHRDAAGEPVRVIGTAMDVTEQRALESQLREVQKMESIGRLAGGIAHDFNNVLTVIMGNAQLMANDVKRAELDEISKAASSAESLTQSLLAFSRRAVLQPAVTVINDVVSSTVAMLERIIGEDVRIVVESDPALWRTRLDSAQLQQILLNLATNARDAMPDGGELTLKTCNRPGGNGTGEDFVMLSVSDNGCGMDEGTRAQLFEPFFTTKRSGKGTGLGLSMVFGIVTQSGGRIEVESSPGAGTTFHLLFPRSLEPLEVRPQEVATDDSRGEGAVLLVEDEPAVRTLCQQLLGKAGYSVLVAADASEAWQLWSDHRGEIDAMLTDVVMPGCSGPELARRLHAEDPQLPVVFMSGYAHEVAEGYPNDPRQAPESFLSKPFQAEELLQKMGAAMERGRIASAS